MPGRAGEGGGWVSDDLLAENLCVAGFNPPVMHRHSALSCFVARAISSVPPTVAGNSGPGGGGSDYLWTLKTWVSADSIRRVIRGHSVGFRFVPPALLGNSPRGGRIICGLWKPGGTWPRGKIVAGD